MTTLDKILSFWKYVSNDQTDRFIVNVSWATPKQEEEVRDYINYAYQLGRQEQRQDILKGLDNAGETIFEYLDTDDDNVDDIKLPKSK